MSTTLVKISVFAIAAFLVAGFVFADLGQSASAVHQKNVNSRNNHQRNSCTDDCNSLTNQNNQNNQNSSYSYPACFFWGCFLFFMSIKNQFSKGNMQ